MSDLPTSANSGKTAAGISVIVPIWRDRAEVSPLLRQLGAAGEVRETIIAAAQADAEFAASVHADGGIFVDAGAPNRGRQMDRGAAHATGDWLLFHHADTELLPAHLAALSALGSRGEIVGGAFYRRFDERHPALRRFEAIERWHNRSFGPLYGDQSLFVRRGVFQALGGFRGLPLMEDVDFSLRLRRAGPLALLDPPIASSPRRHLARGPWRTTALNAALLLFFRLGVPAKFLHACYYGLDASKTLREAHQESRAATADRRTSDWRATAPAAKEIARLNRPSR